MKGYQNDLLKKEVEYILEKIGLSKDKNKYVQHLSGGNKRKLSLGMAIIGGSKIIFLDEPTSVKILNMIFLDWHK